MKKVLLDFINKWLDVIISLTGMIVSLACLFGVNFELEAIINVDILSSISATMLGFSLASTTFILPLFHNKGIMDILRKTKLDWYIKKCLSFSILLYFLALILSVFKVNVIQKGAIALLFGGVLETLILLIFLLHTLPKIFSHTSNK